MAPAPASNADPGLAVLLRRVQGVDAERLHETLARLAADPRIRDALIAEDRAHLTELAPEVVVAAGDVPPALLRAMPRLAWYQQWGAGADWLLDHPWARRAPFVLTNVAGIHGPQIGEHVLMSLLALGRGLPEAVVAQRERRWWVPPNDRVTELGGRRLLLLGYGALGRRIAELASAFGMTVDAVKRTPAETPEGLERVGTLDDLDAFLEDADDVVVTLPLTEETRGLLNGERIGRLRPGARLVNVGRGGIVDEDAVLAALEAGALAGAALDVFEREPLPEASPLWRAPNLLLTAHWAGATDRYDARALEVWRANIERWTAGEALEHVVDKAHGY